MEMASAIRLLEAQQKQIDGSIGAIRARFTPKPREPGRVRDDPAPRGGMGASARAIEDAGGVPPDLPSPSSPFSALRRHETTPGGFSWEKSRPTASLVFTEMPAGTCRGRFFSPQSRNPNPKAKSRTPLTDPTPPCVTLDPKHVLFRLSPEHTDQRRVFVRRARSVRDHRG